MDRDEAALAKQLAKNIKALRADRDWTQADLAQRIDLTPHYIALLETAQRLPTLKALLGIANALGVSVDRLLAADEKGEENQNSRIAYRIASASAQTQLMIEEVVDAILKGATPPVKAKRRPRTQ